jgi:integrase/recombinase XerD
MDTINIYQAELRMRNYCQKTIDCYTSQVNHFLGEFSKHPRDISEAEIKKYLQKAPSQSILKQRIGALKLLYTLVLRQSLKFKYIQYPRKELHLPEVLSKEEVKRLFDACKYSKHKAILYLFYSTGMRVGEVINLKIADIDSQRMVINVRQSKGKRDRIVPLSQKTLDCLRTYFKELRPKNYLFEGQFSQQYTSTSIQQFLKKYARIAGIKKRVYPHLLRHCNATHLYETGTEIAVIQKILGHKNQKTTMIYTHLSSRSISQINTPDSML